ncbi:hypothetical protein ABN763_07975 [Spongiivirga sp. MCCC 1A20706]|uniref:hypothetical protein n=1 Tax=Spongiivirga sp. MCCC 1A20706 TaxID=3160963 RepID=UPI003977429B
MTDSLLFLNKNWLWPALIAGFLLLLVFIWKEYQKPNSENIWIRIFIAFIGISSLVILALKPIINIEVKPFKAVVVTDDYSQQRLDSLKKEHKNIQLVSYNVNEPIFETNKFPDTVFIVGNGIKPYDLWQLDKTNVTYYKGGIPQGIIRFKYNDQVTLGKQLVFKGLYHKAKKGRILTLKGPGGVALDSISLKDTILQLINLETKVRVSGKFLFSIEEKDSTGTVYFDNPLPVIINNPQPLKILMLNGFPTFETKYLKNYLAEMGHELIVRSQITRGRFKYEYFNIKRTPIGQLTEKNLAAFDLVFLDATTFKKFGNSTKEAFKKAVTKNGLGIFIQATNDGIGAVEKFAGFSFMSDKLTEIRTLNNSKFNVSKLPIVFRENLAQYPIHDSNDKMISVFKAIGNGKIGSSVLQNTYELLLRGNTDEYQRLWSKIINEIGKKELKTIEWQTDSKIVYRNHPFEFDLRSTNQNIEVRSNDEYNIPIKEDIDVSNLWHGRTYPKKMGWNSVSISKDTMLALHYFVTDTLKWQANHTYQTILENQRYAKKSTKTSMPSYLKKPLSPLWFFFIFIGCMGYLWLAPKLQN